MSIETRFLRTAVVLMLACGWSQTAEGALGEPTYAALRAARPDGRQLAVRDLTLVRDVFRFEFVSGTFHLLRPAGEDTVSAVFLGQGEFRLFPATENERRHLGMIRGSKGFEVLADSFTELVLHFTDGTFAELAAAGELAEGAPDPAAVAAYEKCLKRQQEKFHTNFHLRLLRDLLREPRGEDGVFMALFKGKSLPPAIAAVDPLGAEELGIGSLLGGEDTAFYVQDPERGGFWYLCDRKDEIESGKTRPLTQVADAVHYTVETEVVKSVDLRGTTTIRFLPQVWDQRVLPISLLADLRIAKAEFAVELTKDATTPWMELPFIQEDRKKDADAAVIFPEPLPQGATMLLRLAYEGENILIDGGEKNYYVGARTSWYPNLASFSDLATYDLTYRIPRGNEVVSVGQPVEERDEGEVKVSRWRTAHPVRVAGFNYGRFREIEQRDEASGLLLKVYTNPGTPDIIRDINAALGGSERANYSAGAPPSASIDSFVGRIDTASLAKRALVDGANMARVGSVYFGELPQAHVAITQQSQWNFGQSWPSLIFMPYTAFMSSTHRVQLAKLGGRYVSDERFERIGYHELAHQWWGHLVGWESYRDQWLSEAFAEFSAILTVQHTEGWGKHDKLWDDHREFVLEKTPGSTIHNWEAGPISDGWRVANKRAPAAYSAITYRKGAFVLHMLRMMMMDTASENPDQRFIAMMREFVADYSGEAPSTADFQAVAEGHMTPQMDAAGAGNLDWFFRQWVDGTDIPRFDNRLEIQRAGGNQYRVTGSLSQSEVTGDFISLVPIYVDFGKQRIARIGSIRLVGNAREDVEFTLQLPQKARKILINHHQDVLARDAKG